MIEDLTDLLAEDWASLGCVREMGSTTTKFFHQEMELTSGSKHLAVFSEDEAKNWILGVSTHFPTFKHIRVWPQGRNIRSLFYVRPQVWPRLSQLQLIFFFSGCSFIACVRGPGGLS